MAFFASLYGHFKSLFGHFYSFNYIESFLLI